MIIKNKLNITERTIIENTNNTNSNCLFPAALNNYSNFIFYWNDRVIIQSGRKWAVRVSY